MNFEIVPAETLQLSRTGPRGGKTQAIRELPPGQAMIIRCKPNQTAARAQASLGATVTVLRREGYKLKISQLADKSGVAIIKLVNPEPKQ